MRKSKRALVLIILLLGLHIILTSCSEYSSAGGDFYAGETITPERIAEISKAIAASEANMAKGTETAENTKNKAITPETDESGNIIVYWTVSGGVWHFDRECGAITNSVTVESGIVSAAQAAGKDRACKRCDMGEVELNEEVTNTASGMN